MTEARVAKTEKGWLEPEGDGWYVLDAKGTPAWLDGDLGKYSGLGGRQASASRSSAST